MFLDDDTLDPKKAKELFPSAVQAALSFYGVFRQQVAQAFEELAYHAPDLHFAILELNGNNAKRATDWLTTPHQGPTTPFEVLAKPDGIKTLTEIVAREESRRMGHVRPTSSRGSAINPLDDLGA